MGLFLSALKCGFWGAWLGGRVVDANGNYNGVWYIGIVLVLAAEPMRCDKRPAWRTASPCWGIMHSFTPCDARHGHIHQSSSVY